MNHVKFEYFKSLELKHWQEHSVSQQNDRSSIILKYAVAELTIWHFQLHKHRNVERHALTVVRVLFENSGIAIQRSWLMNMQEYRISENKNGGHTWKLSYSTPWNHSCSNDAQLHSQRCPDFHWAEKVQVSGVGCLVCCTVRGRSKPWMETAQDSAQQ